DDAKSTHLDERHWIGGVEDHGLGIAVGGRDVGEPFDIAAEPVVRVLHHQRVDPAVAHLLARGLPAAGELVVRNGGGDPVRRGAHEIFLPNPKSFAALLKQMSSRTSAARGALSMNSADSSADSNGKSAANITLSWPSAATVQASGSSEHMPDVVTMMLSRMYCDGVFGNLRP